MEVRFVGQPFADNSNLFETLRDAAASGEVEQLSVLVAWAKRSGLRRLTSLFDRLRADGARSRLIVGIDERGATEEGLRLALELFDDVHVLNDPSGRTFHPKVYLFKGDDRASLFVGSNNATAGGVFFNYEAGLAVDLDLSRAEDTELLQEVEAYIDRLYADAAICRPLTPEVLEELLSDPRYGVGREDRRGRDGQGDEAPDDTDAAVDTRALTLFNRSSEPKKPGPPVERPAGAPRRPAPQGPTPPVPRPARPPGSMATPTVRWSKKLPKSDAHRPTAGSNPTGNVRLTKAGHPIDWTTFFRDDLFGDATWTQEPGTDKEVATIPFRVTVQGDDEGPHALLVSYVPHRESGQANHTTVLHWGELVPMLAKTNFTDHYLTLERLRDSSYHLDLSEDEPSPNYIGP
jgi:HKD family nuclease